MSDPNEADQPPRSPLRRLSESLKPLGRAAESNARLAEQWDRETKAKLTKAQETIRQVVAPTLSKAQKEVTAMGLTARLDYESQTASPSATFRWDLVRGLNVSNNYFTIRAVDFGEYLKYAVNISGLPPSEFRVPHPVTAAWIEEALTLAIEQSLSVK